WHPSAFCKADCNGRANAGGMPIWLASSPSAPPSSVGPSNSIAPDGDGAAIIQDGRDPLSPPGESKPPKIAIAVRPKAGARLTTERKNPGPKIPSLGTGAKTG